MSQEYIEKLSTLSLPSDASITLTYSDGCDVFIHNDTAIETALKETNTVDAFSHLVEHLAATSTETHWILQQLRDENVLDYDEEEDEDGNVIPFKMDSMDISSGIEENFGEQIFVEAEIKRYDYKRGLCNMVATIELTAEELMQSSPDLSGWEISVETPNGTLTFEC
jgi:hypothetical protein